MSNKRIAQTAPLTFNTDPLLGPVSKISAKWDLSIKAAEDDLKSGAATF